MERLTQIPRFHADAAGDAAGAVRRDGATVLEQVWRAETIDRLREVVFQQHPELTDPELLSYYSAKKRKRFRRPLAVTSAIGATGLYETAAVDELCSALLGPDYVYEAFGIIMAPPGVGAEKAHLDGGELFPETGVDKILPPAALTLAIPLIDVPLLCGPTGIAPGTHRAPYAGPETLVPVELERGDIAVWDFRVRHAGLGNQSDQMRPLIYFTACRPFWIDHKNFDPADTRLIGEKVEITRLGRRFARAKAVN